MYCNLYNPHPTVHNLGCTLLEGSSEEVVRSAGRGLCRHKWWLERIQQGSSLTPCASPVGTLQCPSPLALGVEMLLVAWCLLPGCVDALEQLVGHLLVSQYFGGSRETQGAYCLLTCSEPPHRIFPPSRRALHQPFGSTLVPAFLVVSSILSRRRCHTVLPEESWKTLPQLRGGPGCR